jgi:hypothetical protein
MIMILLMIFSSSNAAQKEQDQDQEHEQEGWRSPVDHPRIRATIPSPFLGCRA